MHPSIIEGRTVGESQKSLRQFLTAHLDGTHLEIKHQHRLNIAINVAIILQHIDNRCVQITLLTLANGNLLTIIDCRLPRQCPDKVKEGLFGIIQRLQQDISQHNRPCIDERITRFTLLRLKQNHGIESCPRRFLPHTFPKRIAF
ncbi:hypothetical protein EVA_06888 [gut metagenome]|uniref:Uncharacterized protein n=1 Tax=gut metagenome TaxID=749906 RepID=J9GCC5_9ZZZZ